MQIAYLLHSDGSPNVQSSSTLTKTGSYTNVLPIGRNVITQYPEIHNVEDVVFKTTGNYQYAEALGNGYPNN
jgi:hypothetical protein